MSASYQSVTPLPMRNDLARSLHPYVDHFKSIDDELQKMIPLLSGIDQVAEAIAGKVIVLYCRLQRDPKAWDIMLDQLKHVPGHGELKKFVGIAMLRVLRDYSRRLSSYTESIVAALHLYTSTYEPSSNPIPSYGSVIDWIRSKKHTSGKRLELKTGLEACYAEFDLWRRQNGLNKLAATPEKIKDAEYIAEGRARERAELEKREREIREANGVPEVDPDLVTDILAAPDGFYEKRDGQFFRIKDKSTI